MLDSFLLIINLGTTSCSLESFFCFLRVTLENNYYCFTLQKYKIGFSATVFGELWKLEPLTEERKSKWRREMDWLISPTNYMVELVPAKQNGANGRTMEVLLISVGSR